MNFRIWDRAYNKWVDDYVAGTHFFVETYLSMDGKVIKFAAGFPEEGGDASFSKEDAPQHINGKWYGGKAGMEERYVVLRGTDMNDINEKEIFEGDILEANGVKEKVIYFDAAFWTECLSGPGGTIIGETTLLCAFGASSWKIIGNIYQNPELIGQ